MGEVLMHPMGGGIGSDDVTAAKAHVLAGHNTITTDSDDEVVEGTMPDRGQWQYTESMGYGSDYYAMNQLPEGYYHADGDDWAPEVRIKKDVAKQSQMWSDAYFNGVSDADSRVNRNSASYRDAYNAGFNAGKSSVVATVHLGVWENSDGINGGKHKEDWRTYTKKYGDSSGSGHTKAEGGGEFYISWN